ncbi:MAG: enoyl-CoA hydratase/isomerase family protein [Acidimicrobiia bacterium]|nr:enoyl-CoA hydratase/isomerase family protein [Acidimicrobiia bacterium]
MSELGLAEVCDLVASPWAHEELRAPDGTPLVTVDVASWPTPPAPEVMTAAAERLRSLPVVTVAVIHDDPPLAYEPLLRAFDIVVAPPDVESPAAVDHLDVAAATEAVASAVRANPQAAVSMVQLSRLSEASTVPDALVAESLTYSMLQAGPEFAAWLGASARAAADTEPGDPVVVTRDGSVLRVTLDRPHRRNAYSAAMRDQLVAGLRLAGADPSIEGVLIDGNGPAFCAGGDLAEFGTSPDPSSGHLIRTTRSAAYWLDRLRRNTRVRVHGACVGAGVELPAFAAAIVADPGATFRLPEVSMGLVPGAGGTASIPRRIGRQRADWLAITGAGIDAPTAKRWGLVDRVEPRQRR